MKAGELTAAPEGPATPPLRGGLGADEAWRCLLALRAASQKLDGTTQRLCWRESDGCWAAGEGGQGDLVLDPAAARLMGGHDRLDREALELIELFLPLACGRTGHAIGILGQTIDGFIATECGQSRYINGPAGLVHLHRVRALSDAVLVGASTAVLDRPRLTTRHVDGPHPVRVVIDPQGRLPADSGLLTDGAAPTLVLRAGGAAVRTEALGEHARLLRVPPDKRGSLAPQRILAALREVGLARLLVEGGAVTVSRFLEHRALDRLHLLVAPILLGSGRRVVSLPIIQSLDGALRPPCRRYLLDSDTLFDLNLGALWS